MNKKIWLYSILVVIVALILNQIIRHQGNANTQTNASNNQPVQSQNNQPSFNSTNSNQADMPNQETQHLANTPSEPTTNNELNQTVDNMNNNIDTSIVRPTVRHIIQNKFQNIEEFNAALEGAAILQDYLNNPQQNASAMIKRYDCRVIVLTQEQQNLIKFLTFDTKERSQVLKNGLKDYKPAVSVEIKIDEQGNPIHPCQ